MTKKLLSPLRYPGGKASLSGYLTDVISENGLLLPTYFEPYAGGAGAALALLGQGTVSQIFLNDADFRIFCFWRSVIDESQRFIDRISTVNVTVEEWHRQHNICTSPGSFTHFEVGFATFFMNRCNRSGVVTGAGPIGGYAQAGDWKIDVRFNRPALINRIIAISGNRDRIHLSCLDAVDFLAKMLPRGRGRRRIFVYLDPPYVNRGQRLYLNSYGSGDHAQLANYIDLQKITPWIMSYDESPLVRQLYSKHEIGTMPIQYSLQHKRIASELIISPKYVQSLI